MRAAFQKIIQPPEPPLTVRAIVLWWERRRLAYNAIILPLGAVSVALLFLFASHVSRPDALDEGVDSFAILVAPVLMNIAYTAGWGVQLLMRLIFKDRSVDTGPTLLKAGLILSAGIVMAPAACWALTWLADLAQRWAP